MKPDFSEFSYGFALTREISNIFSDGLQAAPVFPSLISEGRPGGGYDVHLDPGIPLYLQFKISDHMVRPSAKQWNLFGSPYYRFGIRPPHRSRQHDLLLRLAESDPRAIVLYAAPTISSQRELNHAFVDETVFDQSVFIDPRHIGRVNDDAHSLAFQPGSSIAYFCSEPRQVSLYEGLTPFTTLLKAAIRDRDPIDAYDYLERTSEFLRQTLLELPHDAAFTGRSPASTATDRTPHKKEAWPRESAFLTRTVLEAELLWVTYPDDSTGGPS